MREKLVVASSEKATPPETVRTKFREPTFLLFFIFILLLFLVSCALTGFGGLRETTCPFLSHVPVSPQPFLLTSRFLCSTATAARREITTCPILRLPWRGPFVLESTIGDLSRVDNQG